MDHPMEAGLQKDCTVQSWGHFYNVQSPPPLPIPNMFQLPYISTWDGLNLFSEFA